VRFVPDKARRNSFAGLVGFSRLVAARQGAPARRATAEPTMPGSVKQSAALVRNEPHRWFCTLGDVLGSICFRSFDFNPDCRQHPCERRRLNRRCRAQSDSRRSRFAVGAMGHRARLPVVIEAMEARCGSPERFLYSFNSCMALTRGPRSGRELMSCTSMYRMMPSLSMRKRARSVSPVERRMPRASASWPWG
jgi:hypothetical protein